MAEKEKTKKQIQGILHNREHMERVRDLINKVVVLLLRRGEEHDQTKIVSPEMEYFAEAADLSEMEFESEEYKASRAALDSALQHRYANYRHHPEHFKDGINDMNIIDVLEMLIDWKASSERQNGGNLRKSIEEAGERFKISDQLTRILENSVDLFE